MTNDGWGKYWTTQQAVDKAVEKLKPSTKIIKQIAAPHEAEIKAIEDAILKPMVEAVKQDITNINPSDGWVVGWDLGKEKISAWPIETGPDRVANYLKKLDNKIPYIENTNETINFVNNELEFLLAREVKLHLDSKIFTTEALQVGDLAIWDDGDFFCISHVPTLSKFMKAVPTEDDKEYINDQLVSWCTKVQQAHQDDWAKMRLLTPANYATKDVEATLAAQRLKDWCLSVPIE